MSEKSLTLKALLYVVTFVHKYGVVYLLLFGTFATLCFFGTEWVGMMDAVAKASAIGTLLFAVLSSAETERQFMETFRIQWIPNDFDIKQRG